MKSIHCAVLGHNFQLSKHVTFYVKEYKCKHCKKEVTTSSNGEIELLNDTRKEINNTLYQMHHVKKGKKPCF
jgi:CRISPR/Cas system-associated exonuclease Cas4 (RecB family)